MCFANRLDDLRTGAFLFHEAARRGRWERTRRREGGGGSPRQGRSFIPHSLPFPRGPSCRSVGGRVARKSRNFFSEVQQSEVDSVWVLESLKNITTKEYKTSLFTAMFGPLPPPAKISDTHGRWNNGIWGCALKEFQTEDLFCCRERPVAVCKWMQPPR